jgi:hypothetical protein
LCVYSAVAVENVVDPVVCVHIPGLDAMGVHELMLVVEPSILDQSII